MLLDKILVALKTGRILSYEDLARKLDVDKMLIKTAVGQLYNMGYLQRYNTGCNICKGCSKKDMKKNELHVWMVSKEGKAYLKSIKTPS
ncbi:hypothetical protein [Marinisporobacter balticus]|uniref:FeoC-like transcriptional regulator n=1 Tax=Marinisporobacter balticus TaxID=2018667 RepID=A0A4R2KKV4_9FIRM|nr:hypothetical protein [Marinisporobacter balticus]TCO73117.1 FeoC-like transcriptional regulator [Marinisporobacter balticus]